MRPVIALLTDFGHLDPYVGQMKGAILRHAPEAVLIDLCHEVRAHNVLQASFILESSHDSFPAGTIFVCVVDPGVGSCRDILLTRWQERCFLAPDNGLLGFLRAQPVDWWKIPPPPAAACRTFHGRDIFAPLAARLAKGENPDALATRVAPEHVAALAKVGSVSVTAEEIRCHVVHVDRFGNCLLDLPIQPLKTAWRLERKQEVDLVGTYTDLGPDRIGLLAGSQGVMELAMNQTSCASHLGLRPGAAIVLTTRKP